MKFVSPLWLWGILILPLIYLIILFDNKKKNERFSEFIQQDLWPLMVPEFNPRQRILKAKIALLGFAFLFIALARPQFGSHEEVVEVSGLDVMLVLDVSYSMNVEDIVPSRLKAAKHLVRTLVEQLEGDRVGVVAFAGSSYVACPLTSDLSYLLDTVQILNPRMIQRQGTDIGGGLDTALKAIERGAEDSPNKNDSAPPSHVIILISDGEDQENQMAAVSAKIKDSGVKLYVLGVGTEKGGPIPLFDEKGNLQTYKKDRKGQPIVSSFSPSSLSQLASDAGGKYWNITPGEREIESLLNDLKGLNRSDYAERRFLIYEDRFQIPLALAILLFFLEISISVRRVLPILLLFTMSCFVEASEGKSAAPLGSYLENKKGIEAFKEGNIEEAQKSFGAAQARDPSRPELQFNQGIVQFEQGDIDHSIEAFRGSARSSLQQNNEDLYGKSLYNLGNAFAKKGNVKEALQSYLGAIQSAQKQKNQHLEDESRKNLQLLLNQVKKQQEEQKQDQQNQEQQKQDQQNQQNQNQQNQDQQKQNNSNKDNSNQSDNQNNNQDSKEQQSQNESNPNDQKNQDHKDDGQQKKDEQGQKQQSSEVDEKLKNQERSSKQEGKKSKKQQFHSKKMAPEDADRVMSELTDRERELQEKLQTQNVAPQNNLKDW